MENIPNTEYITVKRDDKGVVDVFVGGKPATKYRGENIYNIKYVKSVFKWMQEQNPNIAEFHIMSSKTRGQYAETGNPSAEHGPNAWCRIVLNDGTKAAWVFLYTGSSAARCAYDCANGCAYGVRDYSAFRAAVFGVIDKRTAQNDNAKGGTGRQATSVAQTTPTVSPVTAPAQKITEGTKVYEMGDYRVTVIVEKLVRQK